MVYGLRYYFRLIGNNNRAISLPSFKKEWNLPVILNRSELRELFTAPSLLKHRIVNIGDHDVLFSLKDYGDQGKQKTTALTGEEFLRRFCLHILPRGFVKIRHYGILQFTVPKYHSEGQKQDGNKTCGNEH